MAFLTKHLFADRPKCKSDNKNLIFSYESEQSVYMCDCNGVRMDYCQ